MAPPNLGWALGSAARAGQYAHFRLSLQAIVTGQNRTMRGFGPSKVKVSTS
jgi:hypothetical protein